MTSPKQVAIITGGANGIGAAAVRRFARGGYTVISLDLQDQQGEAVAAELRDDQLACTYFHCDVSDEAQVRERVQWAVSTHGRIDAALNIAGIVLVKPFDEITWEEYRRTFDVNVGGTYLMCKHVLPVMKRQRAGVLINMGSVSGHIGQTDHVMYGASKGAIIAMGRALAWELAPYGIRVVTISPGSVDTPMLRGDIALESKRTGIPFAEVKSAREKEQAFGRWASPTEIAEPLYFLAGDGASFMTGVDVLVDGGWVAK